MLPLELEDSVHTASLTECTGGAEEFSDVVLQNRICRSPPLYLEEHGGGASAGKTRSNDVQPLLGIMEAGLGCNGGSDVVINSR